MSDAYYDELETRSAEEREGALFAALPAHIEHARSNTVAFRSLLADVDPQAVHNRKALADLPIIRKSDLLELQKQVPPFGGYAAIGPREAARVFVSPGPIFEPQARRPDFWRAARALYAAGFRRGELVHNSFSYHLTPTGAMFESGAEAIGCTVFAAGVGQTELQVEALSILKSSGYSGTPSFLKTLLAKAAEMNCDVSSLRHAAVSAEALPPSLRAEINDYGVKVLQSYGNADLGLIAYESESMEGMIVDEGVIVEIVRPGTGEPVADGEVGEVVVTALTPEYPLIRFATGDLSAVMAGPSPCGRTNVRIKGWMGRADQSTKVKGMFVHPKQVSEVCARHSEIRLTRLVVESENNVDHMTLHCETDAVGDQSLNGAIADTIRQVCKLRGDVKLVPPGSLPNDGKVVDDQRTYE